MLFGDVDLLFKTSYVINTVLILNISYNFKDLNNYQMHQY